MPQTATAENLAELTATGTVVLDLWAPWCGPCRILSPMLEELEGELPGLTVIKQNVDDDKSIAEKYGVQSIPTMVIFQNGKAVEKVHGAYPKDKLKRYLTGVLARNQSK
ncbi:thioredoxin [Lacticaseibacillus zhaodongensis]|uniref:thioredoxin n=1 Tax=Lacticaseibacillus zhaodongensis TaxID=2668065 RepID=UPI0012D34CAC|nr:thioredoxin [Lacticaseibacillus zhaodongensis]